MKQTKDLRAKRNIAVSLANQLVATLCGIIIPRVMIGAFGSAVYGATTSIAQFLSYITLLEAGIGRVARGALYEPLAAGDSTAVSGVYHAVKRFFRNVGLVFLVYTLILSLSYHDIADTEGFDRGFTFFLVWAISLSTLAKYFFGLSNVTLLNADQRQYVTYGVVLVTTVGNVALVVLLTQLGCDVLTVKLCSGIIFIIRPLIYTWYVKRHYSLPPMKEKVTLKQKWTGIGQHIAYTVHTNTDVMLLTLFANLRLVSVYSVYYLVVNSIRSIAASFSGGMEAQFGEMIAKGEQTQLQSTYRKYKLLLSAASMVLFGVTGAMILPFVRLYTAGITDVDYFRPGFAFILLMAEAINCIMLPCTTLPISANRLKQTRLGAYGEAAINICLSCLLIRWDPLMGVALGTLAASLAKSVYYMVYASKHILKCPLAPMLVRFAVQLVCLGGMAFLGMNITERIAIGNALSWIAAAAVSALAVGAVSLTVCGLLFPEDMKQLFRRIIQKRAA